MLLIVPTPIGNLSDLSFRALEILKEVDVILAEDTRTSRKLLAHYGIDTSVRSYHMHNEHKVVTELVSSMQTGMSMALISDAGTPGISDPGFLIVRACHEAGIQVSCLPGPTAFVPALVASGIPCDKFHYEGFLPHKKGRQTRLKYLVQLEITSVIYESPHRLLRCLRELEELAGPDRIVCVCRELSKVHEEVSRGTVSELIEDYTNRPAVKGEIVLVISGVDYQGN
jgi:16S rRNA (cytidine1402-2'-O)-methyltransferase